MKLIRNAQNTIHAVSDEHYAKYLIVKDDAGNDQLKPGYHPVTEATARKERPQLFGAADPAVRYTPRELVARRKYAEDLAAYMKADAETHPASESDTQDKAE